MRKLVFLLLAFSLLTFVACDKSDEDTNTDESSLKPTATQKGFVISYTAKWCGPCGSWGSPLIHDYAEAGSNVVAIKCHASGDPMYNSALYSELTADRETGGGIPAFWVGDLKTTSSSAMTTLLGSGNAVAGVDLSYTKSGSTMTVKTATKFFSAGSGDYYLSVYLLESGIPGGSGNGADGNYLQNGASDANFTHDFTLRAAANNKGYGEKIATSPASGKTFDKTVTFTIDPTWTKTLYPVAVLWKFDNTGSKPYYKFVNGIKK